MECRDLDKNKAWPENAQQGNLVMQIQALVHQTGSDMMT